MLVSFLATSSIVRRGSTQLVKIGSTESTVKQQLMKGKFNFFIPVLRLTGIVTPSLFLYVLIVFFPQSGNLWSIFSFFLFVLVVYRLVRSIVQQRFNFDIIENGIEVIDLLGIKSQFIPYQSFKGYSKGVTKTRLYDFKELILYNENDDVYQISQYSFFNFSKFEEEFKKHKELKFLGQERIKWTFEIAMRDLINRQYRFR
jgi:hypothetical protein